MRCPLLCFCENAENYPKIYKFALNDKILFHLTGACKYLKTLNLKIDQVACNKSFIFTEDIKEKHTYISTIYNEYCH